MNQAQQSEANSQVFADVKTLHKELEQLGKECRAAVVVKERVVSKSPTIVVKGR